MDELVRQRRSVALMSTLFCSLACAILALALFSFGSVRAAGGHGAPALDETVVYTVKAGDNLTAIAEQFDTTVEILAALNYLTDYNFIYVGQRLQVPAAGAQSAEPATATATATATVTITATADVTVTETVTETVAESTAETATETTTETATETVGATSAVTATSAITEGTIVTVTEVVTSSAAVEVFSPADGGGYRSPIEVVGLSSMAGAVHLRLVDAAGQVLAERMSAGGEEGDAFFHNSLRFTVGEAMSGTLEILEAAADGDGARLGAVAVRLLPGQRMIDVGTPAVGAAVCSPVAVAGYSDTFEANVVVDMRTPEGAVIMQRNTTGGGMGVYADFATELEYAVEDAQPVLISAYEVSAAGDGLIDQTVVPVTLYPAGAEECETGM